MSNIRTTISRVGEIDALRGVAALSVLLFHYTTRIEQLFPMGGSAWVDVQHGHLGVNLFFIISGYVIFMTLQRTRRPLDFVVSRFSRLFPAYWVAVAATFLVILALGLPGKEVTFVQALANLFMVHAFFGVPHVDGVYWTLEVELLFYAGMFTLYQLGWLKNVHSALAAMLALRLIYFLVATWAGFDLPWRIYRVLILDYIPWFALGINIFLLVHPRDGADRNKSIALVCGSLLLIAAVESPALSVVSMALAALVFGAATGHLNWLAHPVMIWLGTISYTLYLLHENIGWSVLLRLRDLGVPRNAGILCTLLLVLALATLLTKCVEQPAMAWIRSRYRARLQR